MKNLLFPRIFRPIGWSVFVPSLVIGSLILFGLMELPLGIETIVNDAVIIGGVVGALFIVCSREWIEDEMTKSIRLSSLLNSIYIYAVLLIVCTVLINGLDYLYFLFINTVLLPLIFVCLFRWELARNNKINGDEE